MWRHTKRNSLIKVLQHALFCHVCNRSLRIISFLCFSACRVLSSKSSSRLEKLHSCHNKEKEKLVNLKMQVRITWSRPGNNCENYHCVVLKLYDQFMTA